MYLQHFVHMYIKVSLEQVMWIYQILKIVAFKLYSFFTNK